MSKMWASLRFKLWILPLRILQGLLVWGITSAYAVGQCDVKAFLEEISSEEKMLLTQFFYTLVNDSGGYVLLGSKPVSLCCYSENCEKDPGHIYSVIESVHLYNTRIRRGWEIWKRVSSRLSIENYLFLCERNPFNKNVQLISFINKRNFVDKLEEYQKEMSKILGKEIVPSELIEECIAGKTFVHDVLQDHEALLGMLLGYGRNNAWGFQRIVEIQPWRTVKHKPYKKITPRPSANFSSMEEEIEYLNAKFCFFGEGSALSDMNDLLITLPGFRADPTDPETQKLKRSYTQEYHRILRYYKGRDFLEATLEQLVR